jgi:hypothetical protein
MVRKDTFKRFLSGLGALALLLGLAAQALLPSLAFAANCLGTVQANACQITARQLLLEPGATAGGSLAGGTVNHKFSFTLNDTNDNLAAIAFQYCSTAAAVPNGIGCVAPVGVSTSAVTLGAISGATGWAAASKSGWDDAADTVNNGVLLTRTAANLGGGVTGVPVSIELDNIVNPTAVNTTFFVRIWTFQTTTVTLSSLTAANADDAGTVAASTANPIILTGTMPESLIFCTGATINISTVTTLPDCSTATSGNISFNQLFDPNTTSWATSQMAASTNAGQGYQVTLAGNTMKSGTNQIAAIGSSAAVSIPGTAQFGLNLIDDKNPTAPIVTDPTIGTGSADPITYWNGDSAGTGGAINPVSNAGTGFFALPNTGFNGAGGTANHPTYSFNSAGVNTVAESNFGGTLEPTNSQRYTATYIVNVPGNQPAGSYTTTLTYICTATY